MNNRGIALILCYTVILVLTIFASAFVTSTISENTLTTRQTDSTKAFWIAEAGLNQAYYDWKTTGYLLPTDEKQGYGTKPIDYKFSDGIYNIIYDNNLFGVKVTGKFGSAQRTLQASFVNITGPFQNTFSVGGDLEFRGTKEGSSLKVYGKTRISGKYKASPEASAWFEDLGVASSNTTIEIPDYDGDGKTEKQERDKGFNDFVQMGRRIVNSYPKNEVVYLQTDGGVVFTNQSKISGKKVVFVEGSKEKKTGDVSISFSSPLLNAGDDITVISTGDIFYHSSYLPADTRLSTISWGTYHDKDTAGPRAGLIYTHDKAIWEKGSLSNLITGNVIANQGVRIEGNDGLLQFHYSERALKGDLPPGFKWLLNAKDIRGKPKLIDWQEAE